MSEIPKTPDHCAARDYAHDHGLKLHDTCNRCTNPDPDNPCDCPLLGGLDDVRSHLISLRITEPPTFDKLEYTSVCGYLEIDGMRFIEMNDKEIRIMKKTGAKGFNEERDIMVKIPLEWLTD